MKKIFITGTSRGLGQALAEYYCDQSYKVYGCSRSAASFSHKNYTHFQMDLARSEEVAQKISENFHLLSDLDILINNAGLASMSPSLLAQPQQFKQIFDVNLFAPFFLIQHLSRGMIKKKFGRIINFSTVLGAYSLKGHMAYGLSKLALEKLTQELSAEIAPYGVTINGIGVSLMDTDMTKNISKDLKAQFISQQSVTRQGTVKDLIHLCNFYIDNQSDFVSGQVIYMGGVAKP